MNKLIKFFSTCLMLLLLMGNFSPAAHAVDLNPAHYPDSHDKCTEQSKTESVVGFARALKKFIYLKCAPDGLLHPAKEEAKLDQKTLKPILVAKPFVAPKTIPSKRLVDDGTGNVEILKKGLNSIRNRVAVGKKIQLIPYFDPKIPKVYRDAALESGRAFIDAYGDLFIGKSKIYIVFSASPKNIKTLYAKLAKQEGVPGLVDDMKRGIERNTRKSSPTQFLGASGITGSGYKDFSLVSLFYNISIWDRDRMFIVPGEMKHALFAAYSNAKLAPCFLTPGMAGIFGAAFSFPAESNESLFYTFVRNHANFTQVEGKKLFNVHDLSILDGNDTMALIPGSECGVPGDFIPSGIAATYLTGKYGSEKVFEYLRAFASNPADYESAFAKTYGFTTKQFFAEVAPFIGWYKTWYYKTYLNKPVPAK